MNKLDKFDVDIEIFLDRHLLRINDTDLFKILIEMYKDEKPQVIPYILKKFNMEKHELYDDKDYSSD